MSCTVVGHQGSWWAPRCLHHSGGAVALACALAAWECMGQLLQDIQREYSKPFFVVWTMHSGASRPLRPARGHPWPSFRAARDEGEKHRGPWCVSLVLGSSKGSEGTGESETQGVGEVPPGAARDVLGVCGGVYRCAGGVRTTMYAGVQGMAHNRPSVRTRKVDQWSRSRIMLQKQLDRSAKGSRPPSRASPANRVNKSSTEDCHRRVSAAVWPQRCAQPCGCAQTHECGFGQTCSNAHEVCRGIQRRAEVGRTAHERGCGWRIEVPQTGACRPIVMHKGGTIS